MKPFVTERSEMLKLIDPEKPVRVYRNLHRKCFSVKQGVVRFHTKCLILADVKFLVNEKARQRVLAEKRKNVHAFVFGKIEESIPNCLEFPTTVSYNPYKGPYFMTGTDEAIHFADRCLMMFLEIDNGEEKPKVFAKI